MIPKTREEVKSAMVSPDVFCRTCGAKMAKAESRIFDSGFDTDTGGLKWEFSQEYVCPNARGKISFWKRLLHHDSLHMPVYKVTNYLNSDRWYDCRRMDDIQSGV